MERIHEIAPTKEHARNSEGAFWRCKDGRIKFFYTRFGAGFWDHEASDIVSCVFSEDGKTYLGEEKTVLKAEDFGALNLMCPSFLPTEDGLLMYFLVRPDRENIDIYVAFSDDDGETFSKITRCIDEDAFHVLENDRVIRLQDGRPFFMASLADVTVSAEGEETFGDSYVCSYVSDDGGFKFRRVQQFETIHDGTGHQEPGVCAFANGSYMAFARSDTGFQCTAFTTDPMHFPALTPDRNFPSPRAPMAVKPLSDGRYIAIFDCVAARPDDDKYRFLGGQRSPLAYAVSEDGHRWSKMGILESDTTRGYCYTSVLCDRDFLLLGYCAGDDEDGICLNRQRIVRLELSEL